MTTELIIVPNAREERCCACRLHVFKGAGREIRQGNERIVAHHAGECPKYPLLGEFVNSGLMTQEQVAKSLEPRFSNSNDAWAAVDAEERYLTKLAAKEPT